MNDLENILRKTDLWFEHDLTRINIDLKILEMVNMEFATHYQIIPIQLEDYLGTQSLLVVTNLFENSKIIMYLQNMIKHPIHLKFTETENLQEGMKIHYGINNENLKQNEFLINKKEEIELSEETDEDIKTGATSPFIEKVNRIMIDAIHAGASDIHILPQDNGSSIFFRIDGDLEDVSQYHSINGKREKLKIVNRFKVMCDLGLDIAKRQIEQKGAFKIDWNGKEINCRVSVLPTIRGEKVVIRLLDPSGELKDLNSLGYLAEDIEQLRLNLFGDHGLFIIAGPTGSGKTTSNYAMVNYCWDINKKINVSTIEDPPEYFIPRYAQVLVSESDEFNTMLEALLRQDPNIILIGEIRNERTAQNVLRASQTGHKVFTTLHATDCIVAIDRLFSMDIPKRELLTQLTCIASQRLLKINCPDCSKIQTEFSSDIVGRLTEEELNLIKSGTPMYGTGCSKCNRKGYLGRIAVAEFLFFDNRIRDFFSENKSLVETERFLRNDLKFKSMWEKGIYLVKEGKVSIENMIQILNRSY